MSQIKLIPSIFLAKFRLKRAHFSILHSFFATDSLFTRNFGGDVAESANQLGRIGATPRLTSG